MPKKYTGTAMDRRYMGDQIDITYSLKRCIHAEKCVIHLPGVFDRHGRPWIRPNDATPDQVAQVILMCPTGALHFERKDGDLSETPPSENTILAWQNGPLQANGDLSVIGTNVEIQEETRLTLCRCGESTNKPFCDNSHTKTGFVSEDSHRSPAQDTPPAGGKLTITVEPDGPYDVSGSVRIVNYTGDVLYAGDHARLCRCGFSSTRPFCDGTHLKIEFRSE
jgi:CDGSH-type Zn-finger protein/uncharacterized Fe-S cluster protein YjdI